MESPGLAAVGADLVSVAQRGFGFVDDLLNRGVAEMQEQLVAVFHGQRDALGDNSSSLDRLTDAIVKMDVGFVVRIDQH